MGLMSLKLKNFVIIIDACMEIRRPQYI